MRSGAPPEDVAAVVVEPILGEGGCMAPPPGLLEGLWALARRFGFRVIADEVQPGIGQTGRWFAVEHWGLEPDMLVLGKAVGGGMPLSAVIARREVAGSVKSVVYFLTTEDTPATAR